MLALGNLSIAVEDVLEERYERQIENGDQTLNFARLLLSGGKQSDGNNTIDAIASKPFNIRSPESQPGEGRG